jgi:CDP-paratose 2-epimerase
MNSTPTRILITGGAGFVGSNLAVFLRQNWSDAEVVCMDNLYRRGSELNLSRIRRHGAIFHYGDVRDPGSFPKDRFDYLIECSAEPSVLAGTDGSPDYLYHTNLTGVYHCLEKVRKWEAKLLFLSTSRVYPIHRLEAQPWREQPTRFVWVEGGETGIGPLGVSESTAMTGARSLYGWTKFAGEMLIEEYRAAFGVKSVVNRCGVIAGPWQFGKVDQGVAALWVMAHFFGKPLSYIGYGGTGKQVRDYLHVDDLCELVITQMRDFEQWDGWVGNVAGGVENSASLLELTELCREVLGREIPIRSVGETRPADLRVFIGDCAKLFTRTGWRPRRSVRNIVADVAEWVRKHANDLAAL